MSYRQALETPGSPPPASEVWWEDEDGNFVRAQTWFKAREIISQNNGGKVTNPVPMSAQKVERLSAVLAQQPAEQPKKAGRAKR